MLTFRRDRFAPSLRSHRSPYGAGQIVDAERFSHHVEDDVAGQRRQLVVRRRSQHDHTAVTLLTDAVEKSEAADSREHEVEHDDVVGAGAEEPQSLRPVSSLFRGDAGSTQYCPDEVPDYGLVLDDENAPLRKFHPYLRSAILPEPEHRPLRIIICNYRASEESPALGRIGLEPARDEAHDKYRDPTDELHRTSARFSQ
jgi:hypothetical protein